MRWIGFFYSLACEPESAGFRPKPPFAGVETPRTALWGRFTVSIAGVTIGGMERVCFLLQVRPDRLDEYRSRHEHVWPEMLAALRETGWRNYSLFLRDDGLLVGYFETPDLSAALAGMEGREVNARWQAEMASFFVDLDGKRPDESFLRLQEVFHLA